MSSLDAAAPLPERSDIHPFLAAARWQGGTPHKYLEREDLLRLASPDQSVLRRVEAQSAMDISSRFGRRVRRLRQERKLTQTEMAKKFGIDRSYISDLERGRKSISLPMIEVIALGMNVGLAALFENL